jgi:hypothetical protein
MYTVLILISTLGGTYIGIVTAYESDIITRGVMGATTLALIYFLFNPPKNFLIYKTAKLPRDLKFIPISFFLSVMVSWSTVYILDAIYYCINLVF